MIFAGCGKNASPTAGDSTSPVEISGNFGALMNPNLSSRQMMFHGIKIGDPESAVLALPNAHEAPNGLVDFEAWHVAYLVKGGYVTELYIAGPELSKSLDLHHSGDIEVKFGRADIADDSESQGEYDYSGRHLRIAYGPPEAGLSTLWVSVTLVR
ncbi:MAG: hypothetical protein ABSB74_06700 [Tepidisphaeraceae bacterium]